jgi:hypothetical protein
LSSAGHDVVDGVEAWIAYTCLGVDRDQTARRAAVQDVAKVQIAVQQHEPGLTVQQRLTAPYRPLPCGLANPCADGRLGQPSADPDEGLVKPTAQIQWPVRG